MQLIVQCIVHSRDYKAKMIVTVKKISSSFDIFLSWPVCRRYCVVISISPFTMHLTVKSLQTTDVDLKRKKTTIAQQQVVGWSWSLKIFSLKIFNLCNKSF